jgi:hypothetical protein
MATDSRIPAMGADSGDSHDGRGFEDSHDGRRFEDSHDGRRFEDSRDGRGFEDSRIPAMGADSGISVIFREFKVANHIIGKASTTFSLQSDVRKSVDDSRDF